MKILGGSHWGSVLSCPEPSRVAVIGAGIGGLSCARELALRGFEPVVFEAESRVGGRCSSRSTPIGCFDDGAQFIDDAAGLGCFSTPRPGELVALHPWSVPERPRDEEDLGSSRFSKQARGPEPDLDEDETQALRALTPLGSVGVPSMRALADALARPLDIRLRTPIRQAWRRGPHWILRDAAREIDEDFCALVLAMPAPLAVPLAQQSPVLAAALAAVRYRGRWVLLLGTERNVGLPAHLEFDGSPIERIAAMHCKPGRLQSGPQRWFIEASARWSAQHEHDSAETVAELLLDNFSACAGRLVAPLYLRAHYWRHAFVDTPAATTAPSACLWDDEARLGVCGDGVVASRVDRVHDSGVALARALCASLAEPARSLPAAAALPLPPPMNGAGHSMTQRAA
jgi:predicted NAD/FAD-dependent oxidoreductase